MEFTIIIEKATNNYSAYSPELPGCVTTGQTVEETLANMKEAIKGHLELLKESGEEIKNQSEVFITKIAV